MPKIPPAGSCGLLGNGPTPTEGPGRLGPPVEVGAFPAGLFVDDGCEPEVATDDGGDVGVAGGPGTTPPGDGDDGDNGEDGDDEPADEPGPEPVGVVPMAAEMEPDGVVPPEVLPVIASLNPCGEAPPSPPEFPGQSSSVTAFDPVPDDATEPTTGSRATGATDWPVVDGEADESSRRGSSTSSPIGARRHVRAGPRVVRSPGVVPIIDGIR